MLKSVDENRIERVGTLNELDRFVTVCSGGKAAFATMQLSQSSEECDVFEKNDGSRIEKKPSWNKWKTESERRSIELI